MLHPSTKKLIDRLIEMTELGKLKWEEGTDQSLLYATEGYSVSVVGEPHEILISSREGVELERATAAELADTQDEDGVAYTDLVARMVKEASRYARGTETAISSLLADIDRVSEEESAPPVEPAEGADTAETIALTDPSEDDIAEEAHLTDETTAIDADEIAALDEAAEVSEILETPEMGTDEAAPLIAEPEAAAVSEDTPEAAEADEFEYAPETLEATALEETSEETETDPVEEVSEPAVTSAEGTLSEREDTSELTAIEDSTNTPSIKAMEPAEEAIEAIEEISMDSEADLEMADDAPNMTAAVARLAEEVNERENAGLNFPVTGGLTAAAGGLATAVARAADSSETAPEDLSPPATEMVETEESSEPASEVTTPLHVEEGETSLSQEETDLAEADLAPEEAPLQSAVTPQPETEPETETIDPTLTVSAIPEGEASELAEAESVELPSNSTESSELEAETEADPARIAEPLGAEDTVSQTDEVAVMLASEETVSQSPYVPFGLEATAQETVSAVDAVTPVEDTELPHSDTPLTEPETVEAEAQLSEPEPTTETVLASPVMTPRPESTPATDDVQVTAHPEQVESAPAPTHAHAAESDPIVADLTPELPVQTPDVSEPADQAETHLAATLPPAAVAGVETSEDSPVVEEPQPDAISTPDTAPSFAPSFSLSGMQTGFGLTPLTAKTEVSGVPGPSANAQTNSTQKIVIDAVDEVRDSDIPGVSERADDVGSLSYPKEEETVDAVTSEVELADSTSAELAAPPKPSDEAQIKEDAPSLAPRTRFNPWD